MLSRPRSNHWNFRIYPLEALWIYGRLCRKWLSRQIWNHQVKARDLRLWWGGEDGNTTSSVKSFKESYLPYFLLFVLIVCLVGSLFGGFACRARRWNVTPDPGEVSDDSSTQYRPSLVSFYIRRLWGGEGGVSKSKNNKVQNTCIHDSSAHLLDNLF